MRERNVTCTSGNYLKMYCDCTIIAATIFVKFNNKKYERDKLRQRGKCKNPIYDQVLHIDARHHAHTQNASERNKTCKIEPFR
jgi:hypothetical protein